ncbi:sodium/proline symporter [Ruminococcus flavefaciens]|uniref:sodium/proline symporter n=1 Tax=Ruminococcus flavefaciens TaxID=1265 RepID=UPI0026F07EE1|nr:sodium/proline symporter [Ruminococcus flavefaciens]MDD7516279.1 sodium/proline symporter [Ruminococcus flavefaciens]MDY5692527.1 sodium/proline symporter [Ruminococcus flavefaciens]
MNTTDIIILGTIIAYLVGMVLIGIGFSRKNENVGDFYLGGRKLGPIVTAMSAEASDMSSWLLMGLPGVAYLTGGAEAGWTAIGLAVGTYLNWLFVAKRLRVYSQRSGSITIPDFFSDRYKDKNKVLMGIAALIIIIFFVPYTASGFAACGKLFSSLFHWDYHAAMIISAAIIISYTCTGGFLAASTTDLIQSIVMTIALISIVVFGVHSAGGFDNVIDNAKSISGYFSLSHIHNTETGGADKYSALTIASLLAWGLGYFGMPHILLRFMAIEDKNKVKTSRRIASVWVVISMAIAIFIGFIGNILSKSGKLETLNGNNSETIIIKTAQYMSEHHAGLAVIAGLVFAGILACTMSTSDSQLLAASSSMSENILKGVFKIKMDDKKSMLSARAVLLIIAVLGVFLAWDSDSSVFRVVSFAWAGFGATFGPVMLAALFWKRSNKWGAMAGMIVGAVMVFVWKFVIAPMGGVLAIYELLPAFVCAMAAIIIVSLATSAPEKEVTDEFDAVKAELGK